MPKYLCLQRALPGQGKDADKPSPAQMQAMYAKFNEWREKFQNKFGTIGRLMDAMMLRKKWDAGIKGFFGGLKQYVESSQHATTKELP